MMKIRGGSKGAIAGGLGKVPKIWCLCWVHSKIMAKNSKNLPETAK